MTPSYLKKILLGISIITLMIILVLLFVSYQNSATETKALTIDFEKVAEDTKQTMEKINKLKIDIPEVNLNTTLSNGTASYSSSQDTYFGHYKKHFFFPSSAFYDSKVHIFEVVKNNNSTSTFLLLLNNSLDTVVAYTQIPNEDTLYGARFLTTSESKRTYNFLIVNYTEPPHEGKYRKSGGSSFSKTFKVENKKLIEYYEQGEAHLLYCGVDDNKMPLECIH